MKRNLFIIILLMIFITSVAQDDTIHLVLLHTNDIHGNVGASTAFWMNPEFPPLLGGVASIATLIEEVRKEASESGAYVLLIDAGDIWQGTPVGEKTDGKVVLDYFEAAKYDMWILGNHDFDKGVGLVKEMIAYSKPPVITANILDSETGEFPNWGGGNIKPYIIKEYGPIKIGIIGIITDDMPTLEPEKNLEGIKFTLSASTIMKYRDELKSKGCDIIFVSGHTGISYHVPEKYKILVEFEKEAIANGLKYGTPEYVEFIYKKKGFGLQDHDLSELVPGIDVLIGGHSHTGLFPPYEDPRNHTLVVQAYSKGSALGRLDLYIDKKHKAIIKYKSTNYTPFVDSSAPDKKIEAKINKYIYESEKDLRNIIAVSKTPITRGNDETLLGGMIADALREEYNVDFALFNRGGMRADLPAGEISGKDVYKTLPFGNTAVLIDIPGRDLITILQIGFSGKRRDTQISGVKVVYNPSFETKNKLCDAKFIDGTPIELDKTYKMVTSNYLAEGAVGYNPFKKLPQKNTFTPIRDILAHYLVNHTPIDKKLDGRINRNKTAEMNPEFKSLLEKKEK